MESLVADVTGVDFITEYQLDKQIGLHTLPFHNMNKSGASVCRFFVSDECPYGSVCPFRHIRADRKVVCKHWLRGLCKKGDDCEFLHEYDLSRMPECYFFTRFGVCMNKECNFLHIDPASKIQDCPWYDRGFCRNGPFCKNRHVRRKICINYMNGFCPKGAECELSHPKFWPLPITHTITNSDDPSQSQKKIFTCNFCGEKGHKIQYCHKLPMEQRQQIIASFGSQDESPVGGTTLGYKPGRNIGPNFLDKYDITKHMSKGGEEGSGGPRPLDEVTCFKCGEKGHYANKCNKGYLAFLSKNNQQQLMNAASNQNRV
ncbi:Cleavage and polyadenylation specificity factor subunit 4 [Cichlidogyrus casuarinus]|uniref:Cleavage and polyadenylation specificity factor subunit 4 n=1 Tax=Cichlidogyrus casuarinus TaxID=1844966 RepID=A0ABD2PQF1_9PLAT